MKGVATFRRNVVFTDRKAGKVKEYNPQSDTLRVILGDGQKGERDGTGKSCGFVQVNWICTLEKTIFLTDVTIGKITLVPGLTRTVSFLKLLGCLYDGFGIHAKGMKIDKVTRFERPHETWPVLTITLKAPLPK